MGGIPSLIGEFGVPFDLKGNDAFESGDYSRHERALDSYYRAMDANLLGSFLWNYSPDNTFALGIAGTTRTCPSSAWKPAAAGLWRDFCAPTPWPLSVPRCGCTSTGRRGCSNSRLG
jgi:hypothetical protein